MAVAYRAARVVDGVADQALEDGAVLVEDGRIQSVGPARDLPPGAEVVDLGDASLLPGLVDAHVHLIWSASARPDEEIARESRYLSVLRCAANAMTHLRAGVTTARDLGSTDGIVVDVARGIELGLVPGPRVVAAGRAVAMTGGHVWYLGREADGVDAVRQAVRSELKAGAQCIKLMASGGIYGPAGQLGAPQLTTEEMRAAVEEAHRAGRAVAAHAYSPESIANTLDAGVDSIEHGSLLDAATAERMRRQGTYLVPTLSVYRAMADESSAVGVPEYMRQRRAAVVEASQHAFRLALEAGVPIAAGTDSGAPGHPHGTLAEELRLMVAAGASPLQALRFATSASSALLGLGKVVGTLEPGKHADLLAVGGDPLADIRALASVRLVVRGGSVAYRA